MAKLYTWLFGRVLELDMSGLGPPWPLLVFNPDTGRYEPVSGSGIGGSPLLAPGPAPLAAELVVLAGDPPDPVIMGGDYVWLRRYQPNFTLSPRGDVTIVEGRD